MVLNLSRRNERRCSFHQLSTDVRTAVGLCRAQGATTNPHYFQHLRRNRLVYFRHAYGVQETSALLLRAGRPLLPGTPAARTMVMQGNDHRVASGRVQWSVLVVHLDSQRATKVIDQLVLS